MEQRGREGAALPPIRFRQVFDVELPDVVEYFPFTPSPEQEKPPGGDGHDRVFRATCRRPAVRSNAVEKQHGNAKKKKKNVSAAPRVPITLDPG